jgi:hypothetical protein
VSLRRLLVDGSFLITQPPLDVSPRNVLSADATNNRDRSAGSLCESGANSVNASGFKRAPPSSPSRTGSDGRKSSLMIGSANAVPPRCAGYRPERREDLTILHLLAGMGEKPMRA